MFIIYLSKCYVLSFRLCFDRPLEHIHMLSVYIYTMRTHVYTIHTYIYVYVYFTARHTRFSILHLALSIYYWYMHSLDNLVFFYLCISPCISPTTTLVTGNTPTERSHFPLWTRKQKVLTVPPGFWTSSLEHSPHTT